MRPLILAVLAAAVVVMATSPSAATAMPADAACERPQGVQRLVFSAAKYPNIRRHFRRAVHRRGSPLVLVVNRRKADERRDRLMRGIPTRDGFDRDEYPPAVGRVRHVPSSENRSHGASLGGQLSPFCDGVRFRYVFR